MLFLMYLRGPVSHITRRRLSCKQSNICKCLHKFTKNKSILCSSSNNKYLYLQKSRSFIVLYCPLICRLLSSSWVSFHCSSQLHLERLIRTSNTANCRTLSCHSLLLCLAHWAFNYDNVNDTSSKNDLLFPPALLLVQQTRQNYSPLLSAM